MIYYTQKDIYTELDKAYVQFLTTCTDLQHRAYCKKGVKNRIEDMLNELAFAIDEVEQIAKELDEEDDKPLTAWEIEGNRADDMRKEC